MPGRAVFRTKFINYMLGQLALLPTKIITFLKEVRVEMKKVNWPTRDETVKFTLIVIGASAAVALFLGALDYIFRFLLDTFVV